jgi:hypothetical protein
MDQDLEEHPRTVARWARQLRVILFVIGVLIVCAWALAVTHII